MPLSQLGFNLQFLLLTVRFLVFLNLFIFALIIMCVFCLYDLQNVENSVTFKRCGYLLKSLLD